MTEKTQEITKLLKRHRDVEFAYLFGSRAHGTATERSDWDIALFFRKDPQSLPPWTLFYLAADLSEALGEEVQLVTLNNLDSPVFLFEVIHDGLLLQDRSPQKRVVFEANVLRKYHDWQYYLRRHLASHS